MVSLIDLTTVTEEGVEFSYPHDTSRKLNMTPEESMKIQKSINSDIVMQLGNGLFSNTRKYKFELLP